MSSYTIQIEIAIGIEVEQHDEEIRRIGRLPYRHAGFDPDPDSDFDPDEIKSHHFSLEDG